MMGRAVWAALTEMALTTPALDWARAASAPRRCGTGRVCRRASATRWTRRRRARAAQTPPARGSRCARGTGGEHACPKRGGRRSGRRREGDRPRARRVARPLRVDLQRRLGRLPAAPCFRGAQLNRQPLPEERRHEVHDGEAHGDQCAAAGTAPRLALHVSVPVSRPGLAGRTLGPRSPESRPRPSVSRWAGTSRSGERRRRRMSSERSSPRRRKGASACSSARRAPRSGAGWTRSAGASSCGTGPPSWSRATPIWSAS
jgi:hypothetical protein